MRYSPSFRRYLQEEFNPAQEWAKSAEGTQWIEENIPTLSDLINLHLDDLIFGVYLITINGNPWYVGQSIRLIRRLIVHAWHLRYHPERFGFSNLCTANKIEVTILAKGIYNKNHREKEEIYWINSLHPVLQPIKGNDICIPRNKRANVVRAVIGPF